MRLRPKQEQITHYVGVQIVAFGVLLNGILLIVTTLIGILVRHHVLHGAVNANNYNTQFYIAIGITLIYLAILLWRRKLTAWLFTLLVYVFYLGISFLPFLNQINNHHFSRLGFLRDIVLPILIIIALLFARKAFNVRSDIRSFGFALRTSFIVLVVAFCYGIAGYMLMDTHDFHQEINFGQAVQSTVDQFGLIHNSAVTAYTERARLFIDSLNLISIFAVVYILLSLFSPLKSRLEDQNSNREYIRKLLEKSHAGSEDFFKLWPHDKSYYFNEDRNAGLAYRVHRGIALVVGDPFGAVAEFPKLISNFREFCRLNDWTPSFIHTEEHFNVMYHRQGFSSQKIGEEAMVDVDHFMKNVSGNKYFRNISSKFEKQGYTFEELKPPHHDAVLQRLREVSNEWLDMPGHSERGFMMGYFTAFYMELNPVFVLRDQAGTIQAFLNKIPSYDKEVMTYDLLRHSKLALGNSTDYLLINFIMKAQESGFKYVNLGLCPLAGLDKSEENKSIIDSTLRFVYSNGDRIYSFSGLYRYKQKYEPKWSSRYIIYKNGVRGFTKTLTALNVAMRVRSYKQRKK